MNMHIASYMVSGISTGITFRPRSKPTPKWCRADPFDRLAEAYAGIERMGGKVFTLRLQKDVHDKVVSSGDPTRLMSRRIQQQFKHHGLPVPHHAFCLEVTKDDRNELHLHGAIVLAGLPLHQVKNALRAAGGRISGRTGSRQIEIKKFDFDRGGPTGWANYPKKALARTRRVIQHNRVTYIHSELRRLSEREWDRRREQEMLRDAA